MSDQGVEEGDIDVRNLPDRAWNSQRIQIISRKNRRINRIPVTKRRSGDSTNRSVGFAFRNTSGLNTTVRKHTRLVVKSCKVANFSVMYGSQVKTTMGYYSVRSERRLRKSECVQDQ